MPFVAAISKIDFPYKVEQSIVKQYACDLFRPSFPGIERLDQIFDNTEIVTRNFCKPLDSYGSMGNFEERNKEYISISLEYSIKAIEKAVNDAGIKKDDITDIIFVSTTGLATPSMDALIINHMKLNQHVNRMPLFGLGCAGGVSGFAKANTVAKANPKAVVLLVAVELCSLTFLYDDFSKSNFVASSLFSDGVAACVVMGDEHQPKNQSLRFHSARTKLYYDSEDVMGWEFMDEGFRVIFSQDIPSIITKNVYGDIGCFLSGNSLAINDINNFIFHPGGKKVLAAYKDAIPVEGDFLKNTRAVMNENGNMSSVSVLYVLEKFYHEGFKDGNGLMVALGPGFSSDMVLLEMKN